MKKFFIALLLCSGLFVTHSNAQVSMLQTVSNPSGTITDTGADTLSYTLSHSYTAVSIQYTVTKSTGTAAGNAVLYQSVDGTHYIPVDTTALTNVTTNTDVWTVQSAARYWRVIIGGATTVSATASAKLSASGQ